MRSTRQPFVEWTSDLIRRGIATYKGIDIRLDAYAAKRFAIGVSDNGNPMLGLQKPEMEALSSVPWTAAFFMFEIDGDDWVVLKSDDCRPEEQQSAGIAAPLRLWIPVGMGATEGWKDEKSTRLVLRAVKLSNKGVEFTKEKAADLALSVKTGGSP